MMRENRLKKLREIIAILMNKGFTDQEIRDLNYNISDIWRQGCGCAWADMEDILVELRADEEP